MSTLLSKIYEHFRKFRHITTDSRNVKEGSIFFALKGEKYDGNLYANEALNKGASLAVIDNIDFFIENKTIFVEDSLKMLQQLASFHRKQLGIPVIGITGSNGKTTTKELIARVLESHYRTHFTKGNLNNHIGVPLTILEIKESDEIALIEMGANHVGEIKLLCQIADPTHGIITNIGRAHLEGFGSYEGVIEAKGELFDYLEEKSGVAFLNVNEPTLALVQNKISKKVLLGTSKNEGIYLSADLDKASKDTPLAFLEVTFKGDDGSETKIQTQLYGEYNFNNILYAIAVGKYFKVPSTKISDAISSYSPNNGRSHIMYKDTNIIVLDCYNANPSSMKIALNELSTVQNKQKIAIIGDMFELGSYSELEHKNVLEIAKNTKIDKIVTVGKAFGVVTSSDVEHYDDVIEMKNKFDFSTISNAVILVKGSRGMQLEKLFG
ncbi:MAG: UDP-N-acetylmuramoyl-tripeptide--D-alanyl-D-alanine ligase [Saprospiraceae bacterium]|nr:UDP-N-acetylmuramoyl-tripeptide--D-alanyl-D-alanine ligase [Saprospiraceae bacterium]